MRLSERHSLPSYTVHCTVNAVHSQTLSGGERGASDDAPAADDADSRPLWFIPPAGEREPSPRADPRTRRRRGPHGHRRRRRGRVEHARPRHPSRSGPRRRCTATCATRSSSTTSSSTGCWPRSTARSITASPGPSRSRCSRTGCATVLEDHPGIAGLLKTRDPLGPHSLALAEAFLAPLHAAGLPDRETGLAFFLIYDYTLGFALSSPTSVNEQRVQDTATRSKLHAFLRSLPADRFPTLVALGEHVWVDNRDERFAAGLDTLVDGLDTARRRARRGGQQRQR